MPLFQDASMSDEVRSQKSEEKKKTTAYAAILILTPAYWICLRASRAAWLR
jgi:hypothetical protein